MITRAFVLASLVAMLAAPSLVGCGSDGPTTNGDITAKIQEAAEAAERASREEARRDQEWLDESRRQRVLTCVLLDELGRDVVWDAEVDACSDLTPTTTTMPGG